MSDHKRGEKVATPERIVAAALRLFAERGFDAVSLRDITAEAKANIAAVNYHFGSKEGLVAAVVESQVEPVNAERMKRLLQLESQHEGAAVPVAELVEAFVAPALLRVESDRERSAVLLKFIGRMLMDRSDRLPASVLPRVREVADRFVAALEPSLPGINRAEIRWRLHFVVGVVAHTLVHGGRLREISAEVADDPSPAERLRRVVAFCAAGFEAGVATEAREKAEVAAPKKSRREQPTEVQGEFF